MCFELEPTEVYLGVALTSVASCLFQFVLRVPNNWLFYFKAVLGTLAGVPGCTPKLRRPVGGSRFC